MPPSYRQTDSSRYTVNGRGGERVHWAVYNEALRQRGSLTIWFTDEAIAAWKAAPRTTPGGQPHYSDLAITTALTLRAVFHLTLRAVFHLALRQTEGLVGSILQLLGLDLPVPNFSTLSRRAQTLDLPAQPRATGGPIHLLVDSSGLKLSGPGEWLVEKHGASKRRSWRMLTPELRPRRLINRGNGAFLASSVSMQNAASGSNLPGGSAISHKPASGFRTSGRSPGQ
jgi:hypothetical protein